MTDENNDDATAGWPSLLVTGEDEEREYRLTGETMLIGRGRDCDIRLRGQSISRHHARLARIGGDYVIEDLESTNGLFLGRQRLTLHRLKFGESISIGSYTLRYSATTASMGGVTWPAALHSTPGQESTMTFDPVATLPLPGDESAAGGSTRPRLAESLQTLIGIALELNSHHDLRSLQRHLVQQIIRAVPADRVAIILGENWRDGLESGCPSVVTEPEAAPADPRFEFDSTIVERVWRERIALLANDTSPPPVESTRPENNRPLPVAILAVPILTREKTLGLIYLINGRPGFKFDQLDLETLMAISGMASLAIESVRRIERLEIENRYLAEVSHDDQLIGQSSQIQFIRRFIAKVAPTSSTILISGESGTGKEVVAREIHRQSSRADMPFVALNCAALNEQLLESELCGHERGAFTGAIFAKRGKLEVANGGTLFLDEIGEMPLSIQARLLRVIQERVFEKLGGIKSIHTDIRIIAATNRDLLAAVARNQFREDLFYRLNVVTLTIPPLRERREDVEPLARHFAVLHGRKGPRRVLGVAPEALAAMSGYQWPGNVRELGNVIERAIVLGGADQIQLEDLPPEIRECAGTPLLPHATPALAGLASKNMPVPDFRQTGWRESILEMKRGEVRFAIKSANGNLTIAASILRIHSTNLHRLIRKLDMREEVDQLVKTFKRTRRR